MSPRYAAIRAGLLLLAVGLAAAAPWTADSFPSISDTAACGRPGVPKTAVCDPDGLVSAHFSLERNDAPRGRHQQLYDLQISSDVPHSAAARTACWALAHCHPPPASAAAK